MAGAVVSLAEPMLDLIHQRRAALDAELTAADRSFDVDPDLARFIGVTASITPPPSPWDHIPAVSAAAVDEIIGGSRLLSRLRARARVIADAAVVPYEQFWVGTGRPPHLPARPEPLDPSHFVDVQTLRERIVSTKPFGLGLYTSTGILGNFGMWSCYLEMHRGSTLFPKPWSFWSLAVAPDARILSISTASAWVAFVAEQPIREHGRLYPDWKRVGDQWDAVRLTVTAVAATQGIALAAGNDVVAPTYWDVESTLWLRWSFEHAELVTSIQ